MTTDYTLLYPTQIEWKKFSEQKPDVPFADNVIEFLNALSGSLLKDRDCRTYPDVITFAFFCRKANLLKQKEVYLNDNVLRMGRGLLFHIAPSNVPINFGYSLVAGLLSGNINIVRVSSKKFAQVDLIIKQMYELQASGLYDEVVNRIALVRYERTSDANAMFSAMCNVRVIWGGDSTISSLRHYEIPPRSFDVCFADRYSIAVINSDAILSATDKDITKLAESFYNDTYLFDQNACSAPHTIFWLKSDSLKLAKERFWSAVHKYTSRKYELKAVMSVDKLTAFYRQAASMNVSRVEMPDNVVVRTELKELPNNIEDFRCACGYFSEYTIIALEEISPIVSVKYQSLGYYGFEKRELVDFVKSSRFQGLDRIVPIGETTSFALTWDGYNLIETFSRVISII